MWVRSCPKKYSWRYQELTFLTWCKFLVRQTLNYILVLEKYSELLGVYCNGTLLLFLGKILNSLISKRTKWDYNWREARHLPLDTSYIDVGTTIDLYHLLNVGTIGIETYKPKDDIQTCKLIPNLTEIYSETWIWSNGAWNLNL